MKRQINTVPFHRPEGSVCLPERRITPGDHMIGEAPRAPAVSFTGKPKANKPPLLSLVSIVLLILFLAYWILSLILYSRLSPQLKSLGLAEAKKEIQQRINDEILTMSENGELDGAGLIRTRKDASGRIVSLETDTAKLNRTRALIVNRLTRSLNRKRGFTLSVPAGSLTDAGFASFINFPLRVRYTPIGAVSGELVSEFTESGVNQTKYSVVAEIRVSYVLLLPGENPAADAITRVPLSEMILVGDVPHLYGKS